ncbi:MAG: hypothetical protein GAK45_02007 [Pseudomonas citronellolis]|nr:MAG: hypothetical protein GAK45_02007 [Pseudomonas citronellolis]
MQSQEVAIEVVEQRGQACWLVRLGFRGVRFAQEDAARAFAAQLHTRRLWLRAQIEGPEPSSDS